MYKVGDTISDTVVYGFIKDLGSYYLFSRPHHGPKMAAGTPVILLAF